MFLFGQAYDNMVERAGVDMGGMGGIICLKFYFSWTKLVVVDTYASSSEKNATKIFFKTKYKNHCYNMKIEILQFERPKEGFGY